MDRLISLIILLSLLSGCSRQSVNNSKRNLASSAVGGSCMELASDILMAEKRFINEKLGRIQLPQNAKERYLKIIVDAGLKKEEVNFLFESLERLPGRKDKIELFEDFLSYVNTLFSFEKKKALREVAHLFNDSFESHKNFSTFRKRLLKFSRFKIKEEEKILKKIQKEKPRLSKKQMKNLAKKQAGERSRKFKQLYNGCHTKGMTKEHAAGGKAFTLFTISIASLSSGAFYTLNNHDDEEFLTKPFFGKLAYEMASDAVWATIASVIFKDPEGSFLGKSVKMYLADNALIVADAFTWEALFGEGDSEAREKIEEIRNSPEFQEEIVKLAKHLEREKFIDKMKDKFGDVLKAVKSGNEEEKALDIDWENLKEEDLERPEVQEELIQAALTSMYEEENGEMSLGSYGADRYAYYSMIGIPFMFLDTMISTKIYHTMCMAPLNPKKAILTAGLIFSAYSIFYDVINYPLRKHLINQ